MDTACRTAQSSRQVCYPGYSTREVYHTLRPHPALTPVPINSDPALAKAQSENETAYRQLLVQGVLAVLLPTEDLQNGCLRALVSEIFAELILGNGVSGKACESWLLWEGITKAVEVLQRQLKFNTLASKSTPKPAKETAGRLEKFGLLSTKEQGRQDGSPFHAGSYLSLVFWQMAQYAFILFSTFRAIIVILANASSLPKRTAPASKDTSSTYSKSHEFFRRSIITMSVWTMLSDLVELSIRAPWLGGFFSLLQYLATTGPLSIGQTNGTLDRLLHAYITTLLLSPSHLPTALLNARIVLFPNNCLVPARIPPSEEETLQIRCRCAEAIVGCFPNEAVARMFFSTTPRSAPHASSDEVTADAGHSEDEERRKWVSEIEERILQDLLGDSYLTKHLVYGILDAVVVKLMPELGERSVQELLSERLGREEACA